jgi:hypothetical protein
MSSLKTYEPYVDSCAAIFQQRLSEFAMKGAMIDMAHWLQCYAFDVIGDITYSKRFGFLDRGEDVSGLLQALHEVLRFSTLAGIFPEWYPVVFKISSWLGIGGGKARLALQEYVAARMRERNEQRKSGIETEKEDDRDENAPMDFLDK